MSTNDNNGKSTVGLRFQDVEALLADPAPARRAKVVQQLAVEISTERLSGPEWTLALDIMRTMAADAETIVRQAVATSLRHSEHLPRDVALALANDDIAVAQPILESSPVLTDDDLMGVLAEGNGTKQVAVAKRPEVSATLAAAVIDTGNAAAVTTLVGNEGAALNEDLFQRTIERYSRFETVKAAMVHRSELPVTISERLVALVSDRLKVVLASRHALPADMAADILLDARERATVGLLTKGSSEDTQALVSQLHARGRLSPSLVLRGLCLGDVRFCEDAMAEIAGISAEKAAMLIHDGGPLGLKAIYKKCNFPESMYPAFRVAVDMVHETELEGGPSDRERFASRVIERILTKYQEIEAADLDYLLSKLSKLKAA
ncbi:MAG: DUF2336 domain-containing protein [Alphaproteobacteria bacterium]|jgi:uncharacterized protein (DUF2336 family)|nr:DUF2336 domain-containing protein [Alphaproteobacteria bacterium]